MRILVVDDDPSVRELLRVQLEMEGEQVSTAVDGQAALDALAQDRPDVVVLDVMMPVLNGWEVLERLRADERFRRLPVLLLTARDLPQDRQRGRDLGASAVLSKPHDLQVLLDMVHALTATVGPAA